MEPLDGAVRENRREAPRQSRRWRPGALIAGHAAAIALLASWAWRPTRAFWEAIDTSVFALLDGWLHHGTWAGIVAIANTRLADVMVAVVMLTLAVRRNDTGEGPRTGSALSTLLAVLALLLVLRAGPFAELVGKLGWQHASPSLSVEGAVRLSRQLPPWDGLMRIKDSSGRSFPGDHASVVLVWAALLWVHGSMRRRILLVVLSAMFILPRLAAGAHWASDVLVGSVTLALLTLAWGLCSPYGAFAGEAIERLVERIARMRSRSAGY